MTLCQRELSWENVLNKMFSFKKNPTCLTFYSKHKGTQNARASWGSPQASSILFYTVP